LLEKTNNSEPLNRFNKKCQDFKGGQGRYQGAYTSLFRILAPKTRLHCPS